MINFAKFYKRYVKPQELMDLLKGKYANMNLWIVLFPLRMIMFIPAMALSSLVYPSYVLSYVERNNEQVGRSFGILEMIDIILDFFEAFVFAVVYILILLTFVLTVAYKYIPPIVKKVQKRTK